MAPMVTNYLIQYIANYLLLLVRGHFNIQDVEDTCTQAHPESDNFHSVVLPKVMAYYPLHFLSSAIFAPMFIWVERNFNATWNMIAA